MTFMQGNKKEYKKRIFDKHIQLKLVRVSIEVNLILTCWSCSKFWSTSLGRDTIWIIKVVSMKGIKISFESMKSLLFVSYVTICFPNITHSH